MLPTAINHIVALREAGYSGPVSFEAFSPAVHALPDPGSALRTSISFVESKVSE